ncbi:MAG: hypothetical protein KAI74_04945 [Kiritimatiellae bacterium]|nr:hypothetical protein [Kiritimatiellia bacterium]
MDSPCINAGSNANAPGDSDLDGNPRIVNTSVDMGAYEYIHSISNYDGDAFSNADEQIADTDPTDSNSCFHISSVSNQVAMTLYFDSSSNRLYSMIGCSNLVSDIWTNVSGAGPRAGVGGADVMQDTNAAPYRYYRLTVELP